MKQKLMASSAMLLALGIGAMLAQGPPPGAKGGAPKAPGMSLSSPDFEDGAVNVPMGTVSFALIMHDPDAALNKNPEDVLHWMAFNIPGTAKGLEGGRPNDAKLADGTVQGKNRGGTAGFMGPGNPAINPYHHYTMELYALDATLSLGPDATRDDVLKAMAGHIVGKAVLVGRFKRPA
jgi:Raf kinase inhibitor-like YbhB/YbcL family protein